MWFITTIRLSKDNVHISDIRHWGYFSSKEECIKILHKNITDLHEYYYNYAVIEKIDSGLYSFPTEREFFEYKKELSGFFEIKEPLWARNYSNFFIG